MPPWRTAVEIRDPSIPDSRATMASASSEVWRCWASKSAGTYSANITGVIGRTLSRRTALLQVCDSVAAVAIAGFARSVSARSIGTRIDLNICASLEGSLAEVPRLRLLAQGLLDQLRADEEHQPPAAECHVGPVADSKVEHGKAGGRQIVRQRLASGIIAAAGQRQRQFVHAGIVTDQHQTLGIGYYRTANGFQELDRIRAIKFRHELDLWRWRTVLHRLPGDLPGLVRPNRRRNHDGIGKRRMAGDPVPDLGSVLATPLIEAAVLVAA